MRKPARLVIINMFQVTVSSRRGLELYETAHTTTPATYTKDNELLSPQTWRTRSSFSTRYDRCSFARLARQIYSRRREDLHVYGDDSQCSYRAIPKEDSN